MPSAKTKSSKSKKKTTTSKKSTAKKPAAKKRTATRSPSSGKQKGTKARRRPTRSPQASGAYVAGRSFLSQIAPFLFFILAVLLFCSLVWTENVGAFGDFTYKHLMGLFGIGGFLVPILTFLTAFMYRKDVENRIAGLKCFYGFSLTVLFSSLLQLWNNIEGYDPSKPAWNIALMWKNGHELRKGGGVLGGLCGDGLYVIFRDFTPVVIIVMLMIFLLLFFNLTPNTIFLVVTRGVRAQREALASRENAARAKTTLQGTRFRVAKAHHDAQAYHDAKKPKRKPFIDTDPEPEDEEEPMPVRGKSDRKRPAQTEEQRPQKAKDRHQIRIPLDLEEDEPELIEETPKTEEPVEVSPASEKEDEPPFDTDVSVLADVPISIYGQSAKKEEDDEVEGILPVSPPDPAPAPAPEPEEVSIAQLFEGIEKEEDDLFAALHPTPPRAERIPPVRVKKAQGIAWDAETGEVLECTVMPDAVSEVEDPESIISDDVMADFMQQQNTPKQGGEVDGNGMITQGTPETSDEFALAIKRLSEMEGILPAENRIDPQPEKPPYQLPPVTLLRPNEKGGEKDVSEELNSNATRLVETLRSFRVRTKIVAISRGPAITRYELAPEEGVKVRAITNLVDDIALNLATTGVRIEAPIPGKSAVGVEVPNKSVELVPLRDLIDTDVFRNSSSLIMAALGMDVAGAPIFLDVAKMPHLLIAGTTGSGKSVSINCMLVSLLYHASPDQVKLIMIDPKKVELNIYNGLPHLLVPVVSDPKKAAGALHWAVTEMERRFEMIEAAGVRDLKHYNASIEGKEGGEFLPQIVIVIDELADLMMTSREEVETSICRIAQKARAAGMHLIIGTQRPSVNVVTGVIKANIPSRIAFKVAGQMDSRVILDSVGAEKLIGNGDMLYAPVGCTKPIRVQGAFVSSEEIDEIVAFIKNQARAAYDAAVMDSIEEAAERCSAKKNDDFAPVSGDEGFTGENDPMMKKAIELAVESGKISTSLIQRRLSLGYGRAAKIIDRMEQMGIVGAPDGQKPRQVLITAEQYTEMVVGGFDDFD